MFDLKLQHAWGGALIIPQTDIARDWCSSNLDESGESGWLCYIDADGDYSVDHRDGLDVAIAAKAAGLTFANYDILGSRSDD